MPLNESHILCFDFSSIECLHGTEHHGLFDVSINHGYAEYFKPMFYIRGAS